MADPLGISDHFAEIYHPDWPKCDLNDFSSLDCREGKIFYRLYQQDGTLQEMNCTDTYQNRLYVSWVQIHDRYTVTKP